MTAIDPSNAEQIAQNKEARKARTFTRINKADAWFQVFGLAWLTPILKAAAGDNPRAQMGEIWRLLGVPLLAIAIFIAGWARLRQPCKPRSGLCRGLPRFGNRSAR
jgi:nitrate/nitrite transport system permease protein